MSPKASVLSCAILLFATSGQAQPVRPLSVPTPLLQMFRSPDIRAAMELEDYQADEIAKLESNRRAIGSRLSTLRRLPMEERAEAFAGIKLDILKLDDDLKKLLSPKQLERLKQIELQVKTRADRTTAGLHSSILVEALGLTEAQRAAIEMEGKELEAKLKLKIEALQKDAAKAREESRLEILKLLTDEQRKEYERLMGAAVDMTKL